ncbi:hypothetical protein [Kribbella sp. NPDC000426]|uniref:hypothetical protein n=1 Tax=Kribbella sp. NPDC000426 TaxID=3154255 RepID=UPI00331CF970
MDGNEVTSALQSAYGDLVRAVELTRRRPDDRIDTASVVSDLHELRVLMSAAAQMMRSFHLGQHGATVKWAPGAEPEGSDNSTPSAQLEAVEQDLLEAYQHLERAAASLTVARRRLADLR